ncbi:MAG TPA: hypothetical protein DGT23_30130 [Micromonosporaceae bacterium]|nr:hypothetical protein [Micromonosporaceae bacterium]
MTSPAVLPTRLRRRTASPTPILGARPAADHQPRPKPNVAAHHELQGFIRPPIDMLGQCVCGWPLIQDEIYGWLHLAGSSDLGPIEEVAAGLRGEQAVIETSDPQDIVGASTTTPPAPSHDID